MNSSASWVGSPATTPIAVTGMSMISMKARRQERIGYVTDMLSERACAYARTASVNPKPYFLSLHYTAPHWPWSAPSNEAAARVRELDRNQLLAGGSVKIYA